MGPTTLFDKSFLQALSVDEAVWFDHFMIPVVCPVFIVETLGDLFKEGKQRPGIEDLRILASKAPEKTGCPTVAHWKLLNNELKGGGVKLDLRPHLQGGEPTFLDGKKGMVFDVPEEQHAFQRWSNCEFLEVEKTIAKSWRKYLENGTIQREDKFLESLAPRRSEIKNLEDVRFYSEKMFNCITQDHQLFTYIFQRLNIPPVIQQRIYQLFLHRKPLSFQTQYPYLNHILRVESFFYLAVRSDLISHKRLTNYVDFTYYFYLPFAMVFVSCDKLHKRTGPKLITENQRFVDGNALKTDLKKLNDHYLTLPEAIREKGIHDFAPRPPSHWTGPIADVWDQFMPGWRKYKKLVLKPEQEKEMVKRLIEQDAARINNQEIPAEEELQQISLKRLVAKKKGSWFQLPKDIQH